MTSRISPCKAIRSPRSPVQSMGYEDALLIFKVSCDRRRGAPLMVCLRGTNSPPRRKPRLAGLFITFYKLFACPLNYSKSLFLLAEAVRFELTDGCPSPVFKTGAIDHSATLPVRVRKGRRSGHAGLLPFGGGNDSTAIEAPRRWHGTCRGNAGIETFS